MARTQEAEANPRVHQQRQDLHDFILFMVASMMRVGEVRGLRVGQCRPDPEPFYPRLLVEVRGKTGYRTVVCKVDALLVFEERAANKKPDDLLFEHSQKDSFRELLIAAELFGTTRNLKSLRATAISLFILDNPTFNLQAVARNAGTSLAMIDNFYAKKLTAQMYADGLGGL